MGHGKDWGIPRLMPNEKTIKASMPAKDLLARMRLVIASSPMGSGIDNLHYDISTRRKVNLYRCKGD